MTHNEWSQDKPTAPGWYWYHDSDYGPAPVYLTWIGFPEHPKARTLEVDQCVGQDQSIVCMNVNKLDGLWATMSQEPGARR